MPLVVEDGSGVLTANAYMTSAQVHAYATDRALTFDITNQSLSDAAIIRTSFYIDNQYRARFPGFRTYRRAQGMEWPRAEAYYYTPDNGTQTPYFIDPRAFYPFDLIPQNTIPPEILAAVCIGAVKELAEPGVLQPDLERGGYVSSVKAGSVSVNYAPGAMPNTVFQDIENALSGLLQRRSGLTARAVR